MGGILLNPTIDKVLLVKGWSKNSAWGFPKGKRMKDETDENCAIREVCLFLLSLPLSPCFKIQLLTEPAAPQHKIRLLFGVI